MATVTRENIGLLNDKITVTVSKEDYLPSFEKALKHYAKAANVPGFRKGMVPSGVIKKMHGPAVFSDEVLRSIEKGLTDYMTQEKLDIFAQPLPSAENDPRKLDMNNPAEYSFAFEVGLKPEFKMPDLAKLKLTKYNIEVTDSMIDEEVKRLQSRLGKMTEPETVTSDENVLNIKFEETDKDGNPVENGIVKENSLLVKYFSESVRPELMGKKKDDSVVVQLKSGFEDKEREWLIHDLGLNKDDESSVEKYFKATITKVGLVENRELNEEFFKEVYPNKEIKTEAEFREQIKSEIANYWASQSRNHLHHELYHALLDGTQVEFPESFLKRWLLNGGEKPKSPTQVEEEFPIFKNQLKWTLISDDIIKGNNLEVNPQELRDSLRSQVMSYFGSMGADSNLDWLDTYVDRMMKDEQQVESAYRRLITEKLFNWAETQIQPNEKSISVEDFQNLQKEHEHHAH
ncbi:MAG: trigger factor [Bacteroidetes bacterium]|nr:MAG: trigger factor [Bacteroidota bacterium]